MYDLPLRTSQTASGICLEHSEHLLGEDPIFVWTVQGKTLCFAEVEWPSDAMGKSCSDTSSSTPPLINSVSLLCSPGALSICAKYGQLNRITLKNGTFFWGIPISSADGIFKYRDIEDRLVDVPKEQLIEQRIHACVHG